MGLVAQLTATLVTLAVPIVPVPLDTVHVWPGEAVRIVIDFAQPFSGDQDYVFHCHNLEHEEAGMMIRYRVKA